MGIELIAELATNHGGDVALAKKMIDYAVAGGAHTVKTQAYRPESVNPSDPQAQWLRESALSVEAHHELQAHAKAQGADYFVSVFDSESIHDLKYVTTRFKVASTEAHSSWWTWAKGAAGLSFVVSYPWEAPRLELANHTHLVTVPVYPTPVEVLPRVRWGTGWSDHCVGISACVYAAAHGATTIEVHVSIPGEGRNCVWDKTQEDLKRIREWMEECQVMRTGVSKTFRQRWVR